MKRIPFKIVGEYLCYTDNRTIRNWCKRHGVYCFRDGKCWYVYEEDFKAHTQKPDMQEEEKKSNFTTLKRFIPQTSIAKSFEKKFSHIS